MKKRVYSFALGMGLLAAISMTACGGKKAESQAASAVETASSAVESAASAASSAGESAAESAASEGAKAIADFKAADFKATDELQAQADAAAQMLADKHEKLSLADGVYEVNVTLAGGSGRAKIASPTELTVKDGRATAKIVWSSDKYDYMEVDGIRFTPNIENGHSVFVIPVTELGAPQNVVGDTTAMSKPHAIDYQLTFEVAE
ncbi:hypothetical protein QU660_05775 [Stomatobaculum sp. F0698]|uniref:hypothetical protein n=1 Tax=Stomatobaculum sp. F0698 TaxID=3059030 RepID=UPI00272B80AA|nr:hypothetical protein [Stomatobaculum sp. F0698]WLD86019.1 hypothetical protein QU660_05775 [Stomatobaculum sp. F0698]